MSVSTDAAAQTGTPGRNDSTAQGSPPATQTQSGEKTFSQADLDNIIKERLAKQKETMEGQARAEREKADREATEAKAREQGEYQKLAESEKARAEAAEAKAAEIEDRTRQRIVKSEIRALATEMQFAYPDDVPRLIDADAITFDDDGEPTNIKALLERLAKDRPLLIANGQQGGNAAIPRTPNGTTITADQFREQEKQKALRSGKYSAL